MGLGLSAFSKRGYFTHIGTAKDASKILTVLTCEEGIVPVAPIGLEGKNCSRLESL